MSIEITGPQAYDFQYILAVFASLSFLKIDSSEVSALYVERINGEDIELHVDKATMQEVLEIQVKSEKGDLDIEKLSTWLCHFEERKSDACTLSRLIQNNNRKFVIATGCRCTDNAKKLLVAVGSIDRDSINFSKAEEQLLVSAVANQYQAATSTLKKNRYGFCQLLASKLDDKSVFEHVMNSVIVWEQLTKESMIATIRQLLNINFHIPQSLTQGITLQLLEIIKDARDARTNIIERFRKLIDEYQGGKPPVDPLYIERPNEGKLIQTLRNENALLLKGNSLCGKTNTSLNISDTFYKEGYNFHLTDSIDDARTFLYHNVVEDRICFLDDPMGHAFDLSRSDEQNKKVFELIKKLPASRKLIVTCNNEVEKHVRNSAVSFDWIDLTVTSADFALQVWTSLVVKENIPAQIANRIAKILGDSRIEEIFQPGQLEYLAKNYSDVEEWTDDYIRHYAAIDAQRIALKIEQRGNDCERLYRILGILSSTITSVSTEDLRYVLSPGDEPVGFLKREPGHLGASFFENDREEEVKFPIYESIPPPAFDLESELDYLEERGYINSNNGGYQFAHPIYYQAAFRIMQNLPTNKANTLVRDLKKSLGVLSVENALLAGSRLKFIYSEYPNLKEKILSTAKQSCLSIFPSVQDVSYTFLLTVIKDLNSGLLEFIQSWLAERDSDTTHIFWRNGVPYLSDEKTSTYERMVKRRTIIDEDTLKQLIHSIESDEKIVSPEAAWQIANFIKQKSKTEPYSVSEKALDKILDYKEGFIREIAAFHVLYSFSKPQVSLIEKVFGDSHPYVVFQAIKGSFRGWPNYDALTKEHIMQHLRQAMGREDIALRAKNFMTQFAIGYSSYSFDWMYDIKQEHKIEMWDLWSKLMPEFFKHVPASIFLNGGRFQSTMMESLELLNPEQLLPIAKSWISWLNKYLEEHQSGSEDAFYLTEYFLQLAANDKDRLSFSESLINHPSFSFSVFNLRKFIAHWNELITEEKELLKSKISSDSIGIIKAIALTAKKVPEELIQYITKDENLFQYEPEKIIRAIDINLLQTCIYILYGEGPLRYLPFAGSTDWDQILKHYLLVLDLPLTKLAVKESIHSYRFGQHYAIERYGDATKPLKRALAFNNEELNQFILIILIEELVGTTHTESEKLWTAFMSSASPQLRESAVQKIFENVEAIDSYDNFGIIIKIVDNKMFEKQLSGDYFIWQYLKLAERMLENEIEFIDKKTLQDSFVNVIKALRRNLSPRLHSTMIRVQNFAKRNHIKHEDVKRILEDKRLEILEIGAKQQKYWHNEVDQELAFANVV